MYFFRPIFEFLCCCPQIARDLFKLLMDFTSVFRLIPTEGDQDTELPRRLRLLRPGGLCRTRTQRRKLMDVHAVPAAGGRGQGGLAAPLHGGDAVRADGLRHRRCLFDGRRGQGLGVETGIMLGMLATGQAAALADADPVITVITVTARPIISVRSSRRGCSTTGSARLPKCALLESQCLSAGSLAWAKAGRTVSGSFMPWRPSRATVKAGRSTPLDRSAERFANAPGQQVRHPACRCLSRL